MELNQSSYYTYIMPTQYTLYCSTVPYSKVTLCYTNIGAVMEDRATEYSLVGFNALPARHWWYSYISVEVAVVWLIGLRSVTHYEAH